MEPEMSLMQKCKFKDLIQLLRGGGGYKYSAKFFESLCCQKCCMILKQKSPKAPGKEPLHYSRVSVWDRVSMASLGRGSLVLHCNVF